MKPFISPDLLPVMPEIFLAVMTLLLLMVGALASKDVFKTVNSGALFVVVAVAAAVLKFFGTEMMTFGETYTVDAFTTFMKVLVLTGSAAALFMSGRYAAQAGIARFEYPVLVLLSTLGMMLMTSANSLLVLYMALELQSLPLYVLAAMRRDHLKSTEAGLKYFVLGALSSGMLLYGSSLIYGYTGSIDFGVIKTTLTGMETVPAGVIFGLVLVLSGLAFKVAAVPFHMWSPDVYEGAPTSVTAFFALAPKMAAVALLTRVLLVPFAGIAAEWQQIVVLLSVASMAVGAVAAVSQTNIKRLMAYSSIGHIGFTLVGLAAAAASHTLAAEAIRAVIVYMTIYLVSTIGVFAIILMMRSKDRMLENISDLSGLAARQPMLALSLAILMFSMAGIPPLAGFFAKLFIFKAAVAAGLYTLAILGVLASVISAFYYIRIIKVMYFDAPAETVIDTADDLRLNVAATVTTALVLLYAALPLPLLGAAGTAAAALLK